jgi:hypothetical protein
MVYTKRVITAVYAVGVALVTACAQPNIIMGSWKDTNYTKQITSVFVIGVTQRSEIRQAFETAMVQHLHEKGLNAVASADSVPLKNGIAKETVKAEVKAAIAGKGFDAVLVSRLIGVDKTSTYVPPSSHMEPTFSNGIMTAYSVAFTPGYLVNDTVVSIETNLYDTATEKLVWSMTSKSFNPADAMDVIKPLTAAVTKDLAKNGMISVTSARFTAPRGCCSDGSVRF